MNSKDQKKFLYKNLILMEIQEHHLLFKKKFNDFQMKIVIIKLKF